MNRVKRHGVNRGKRECGAEIARLRARVAELEAQINETRVWLDVWGRENMTCSAKARELEYRHRALLAPPQDLPAPGTVAEAAWNPGICPRCGQYSNFMGIHGGGCTGRRPDAP